MTTLPDRPNTALLVIDVQNAVVTSAVPHRDDVVANINTLVGEARAQGVPVVWVQHSDDEEMPQGSKEWELVPELARLMGIPIPPPPGPRRPVPARSGQGRRAS